IRGRNVTGVQTCALPIFEHVKFRYAPDVPLIEDMNLRVWPGQRIALVGPTGCGKTTLVNLLMRFYEINGGCLKVDDHPIDAVTRSEERRVGKDSRSRRCQ